MKNTYTIQKEIREGKEVYVVYKNGPLNKTFPTLEKAEEYKRQKEEENGAKKCDIKRIVLIVLLSISIPGIILTVMLQERNYITAGYFIALCCGLIIGSFFLRLLMKNSIDTSNYRYKKRFWFSFLANISFSATPMLFVIHYPKFSNELLFLIPALIIYIETFILLYKFVKINKKDDTSLLKATNYFIAFIFTAIKLLQEKSCPEEKGFLISYFMLLPLLLTQSLYELFDSKSKANDENKATPIQS